MDNKSQNFETGTENREKDSKIGGTVAIKRCSESDSSFTKLCGETTLHGIKYVFDYNKSQTRRFIWTGIFLVQFIGFVVFISLSLVQYLNFAVTRKISVIRSSDGLFFPSVTLCNYNLYRESVIAGTDFEKQMLHLVMTEYHRFSRGQDNSSQLVGLPPDTDGDEYERILNSAAHNISEFLLDCTWLTNNPCDARNFTRVYTDIGLCYTFNTKELSTDTGYWNGLKLRLSVEEEEYSYKFISGVGFKMLLHSPNEFPFAGESGFTITPGLAATVAIELQVERSLPTPYENKCGSKSLKYFDEYSFSNCRAEVYFDLIIKNCGCKTYYMPDYINLTRCSAMSYICVYTLDISLANEICPLPCSTLRYIPYVTYAKYPDKTTATHMAQYYNRTEEYVRDNYLEATIFFKTLRYEKIEETEAYSINDLGAYVGGQMGLTIGASLLTVCEWVDWIFAAGTRKWKARQGNRISAAT